MSQLEQLIQEFCPDGVEHKRIDEICTIKARIGWQRLTTAEYLERGDYYLITGTDFTKNGEIDLKRCCFVTEERYKQDCNIQIQNSDVLITKDGTLGKVAMVKGLDKPATLNSGIFVVRPIDGILLNRFLYYLLCSDKLLTFAETRSTSSTIKHLTQQIFIEYPIPVPPLLVQKEIVRILDNFTELAAELTAELTARKKQYEYYRDSLLNFKSENGETRLQKLIQNLCPEGVEYRKIKEVYKRLKGTPITAAKMKEIKSSNGNIRIFAGGKTVIDAHEKDIPNANITKVPAVLIQSRGLIDAIYCDKPFTFKNEMWAYTSDNINKTKFLYYILKNNMMHFREAASGMGSLPQISLTVTEDFKIPVPPLAVQERIVSILDRFDTLCNDLTSGLPAEIAARQRQYEYYRDRLLTFKQLSH